MQVYTSLAEVPASVLAAGSSIAIGKFDGLHRGHQAILSLVRETAEREGLVSVVVTFSNHPLSFLRPEACPRPLMSPEQRVDAFADAGIDVCLMLKFDEALASLPAEEFVTDVLVDLLSARHVVMGVDFRFGYRGAGDGLLLNALGERHGFDSVLLDTVVADGIGAVSSSRIRQAIASGDVAAAAEMLDRAPAVRGEVVHGDARGREIGFPTANLGGDIQGFVPADGVYAGWVLLDGDPEPHAAAVSVGNNPTFTPYAQSRVESFLLDFSGDLYGRRIEVRFVQRLRGMEAFDSLDALLERMHADIEETRALLSR